MDEKKKHKISKFLSLLLRHQPETIQLSLDAEGWADVEELLLKSASHGMKFDLAELENVVATNDKKRFAFNEDHTKLRANQGHSIDVDLHLRMQQPPEILYHGTVGKFITAIRTEGLKKMERQHVHLSPDVETAQKVASRRGRPVILKIRSGDMFRDGFSFFLSENGVWLSDAVPANYIQFQD